MEVRGLDIVEEAFRVVDGLQEAGNEGEPNGDVEAPFEGTIGRDEMHKTNNNTFYELVHSTRSKQ